MFVRSGVRPAVVGTALVILLVMAQLAGIPVSSPASAAGEQLLVSTSPDRSSPVAIDGTTLHGDNYIFVTVPKPSSIRRVAFILDGDVGTRTTDDAVPFDRAGTTPDGLALPLDVSSLGVGEHSIEANVRFKNNRLVTLRATFTVTSPPAPHEPEPALAPAPGLDPTVEYLLVSTSPDRANPVPVDGTTLHSDTYIFVTVPNPASIRRVAFVFDGDVSTRTTDDAVPFDRAGTAPDGLALPLDVSALGVGEHSIEANVRHNDDSLINLRATFTVTSPPEGGYVRAPEETVSEPPLADEVIEEPVVEESAPPSSAGRLGLHVTADELATWRQRAASGPYRVQGDVTTNSPGDWTRVQQSAASFMANPAAGRWNGPTANNPGGCVLQAQSTDGDLRYTPSHEHATELRDAAFVALIQQDQQHAAAVRTELLAQAATSGVDFTNRTRYCLGTIDGDNKPIFNIANWQTRLLYAYDYVRIAYPDLFTASDTALLDRWFAGSAEWMQEAADSKLAELFIDRDAGDYRLTGTATNTWSRVLHFDGPDARTLQRRYNNRVATAMRYVTLVGVDQSNHSFIDSGRRFATEFIRFSYYPSGVFGEFERWTDTRPILGWKYSTLAVGSVITIADAMARAGDPSVYTYTTTDGALGTQGAHHTGAPKSVATMVADLMRYVDHSYTRHGTATATRATDNRYLIDSVDEISGDNSVHDTMLTMSNRYYQDPYVRSVYERTAPGAPGYPANPTHGQGHPEGGEWGTYPGALFMFGGLEHAPTPYPTP